MLFIYGSYLVFQLFSHKALFSDNNPENFKSTKYTGSGRSRFTRRKRNNEATEVQSQKDVEMGSVARMPDSTNAQADGAAFVGSQDEHTEESTAELRQQPTAGSEEGEGEVEEPTLSLPMTIGLLAVVTVVRTASRHTAEKTC